MFTLLGAGMLLIFLNYIGVFGDPNNIRLVIGLGLILAGILVATRYH
jgi:multidrug transporter EmrE-like cation transporter